MLSHHEWFLKFSESLTWFYIIEGTNLSMKMCLNHWSRVRACQSSIERNAPRRGLRNLIPLHDVSFWSLFHWSANICWCCCSEISFTSTITSHSDALWNNDGLGGSHPFVMYLRFSICARFNLKIFMMFVLRYHLYQPYKYRASCAYYLPATPLAKRYCRKDSDDVCITV